MKAIKRTSSYREHRPLLRSPAPSDVWHQAEDNVFIAMFPATPTEGMFQSFIGFAIEPDTLKLKHANRLDIKVDQEGWHATNAGSLTRREAS